MDHYTYIRLGVIVQARVRDASNEPGLLEGARVFGGPIAGRVSRAVHAHQQLGTDAVLAGAFVLWRETHVCGTYRLRVEVRARDVDVEHLVRLLLGCLGR